VNFIMVTTCEF